MVTGSYVALSGCLVMIVIEKIVILFLVVWLVTVMFCEHHLNVLATIFNCTTILDGAGLIVLAGGADRLEL